MKSESTSLYDFKDYKSYLKHWTLQRPHRGHGEKKKMADHLRCHNTYVTQVIEGNAHFSLEQAEALNSFLQHDREESLFFLLLVQANRAGTASLRKHFETLMNHELEKRHNLKDRLEFKDSLSEVDQAQYYSAWYFTAIHLIVSLSPYTEPQSIARALQLSNSIVLNVLEFLVSRGLVLKLGTQYSVGPTSIHLGKDSPMLLRHHSNWRLKTQVEIEKNPTAGLHYSSVVTLGRADIPKVKEIMVQAIEQIRAVVRPSPNEELCCYTLDFFELTK